MGCGGAGLGLRGVGVEGGWGKRGVGVEVGFWSRGVGVKGCLGVGVCVWG